MTIFIQKIVKEYSKSERIGSASAQRNNLPNMISYNSVLPEEGAFMQKINFNIKHKNLEPRIMPIQKIDVLDLHEMNLWLSLVDNQLRIENLAEASGNKITFYLKQNSWAQFRANARRDGGHVFLKDITLNLVYCHSRNIADVFRPQNCIKTFRETEFEIR
ncbi:MAG: hypothetical protein GQ574_08635 [Crocinitomix sp.]|nr:hypothetical protein [Crocinitomix sp.]